MKSIPASRKEKLRNAALGHRPGHTGRSWRRLVVNRKGKGRPARKPKEKK